MSSPEPRAFEKTQEHCVAAVLMAFAAFVWIYPYTTAPSPNMVTIIIAGISLGGIAIQLAALRMPWSKAFHAIVWGWLIAGLINAAIIFLQYFQIRLPELPLDLQNWIIQNLPTQHFNGLSGDARVFGHIRQRNQAATFMCISLACSVYLWHHASPSSHITLKRWLLGTTCFLLSSALAATSSRIGLLELGFLLACLWWMRQLALPFRTVLRGTGLGLVMGAVAFPWMLTTWVSSSTAVGIGGGIVRMGVDTGCDSRILMWRHVLELVMQRPWTGWGWEGLARAYYLADLQWSPANQPGLRLCAIVENAHNLFLQIAVELGLLVAAAMLLGLVSIIWRSRPWRETNPQRALAWVALTLVMAHSMVEYPLWHGQFMMLCIICMVRLLLVSPQSDAPLTENARAGVAFAGLVLVLAFNFVQHDYHLVSQPYLEPLKRDPEYAEHPLDASDKSVLFKRHAQFARTLQTPLTPENASQIVALAQEQLQHGPDTKIVRRLITAAEMSGQTALANEQRRLYERAFPDNYRLWLKEAAASQPVPASFSIVLR
jgi:O-antigen polymerase